MIQVNNHLDKTSDNILLIPDLLITRKVRETVYSLLKKKYDIVANLNSNMRVRYNKKFIYVYIFPNIGTLLKNIIGTNYKNYYFLNEFNEEKLQKILDENLP